MKHLTITAAILAVLGLVTAQEGRQVTTGPSTSTASYSCDSNACKLPNCLCASQSPPNGLNPKDVPQFVVITFDDSVQATLLQTANELLNVKNPNGCPAKGTWYVSMMYTDFSLVQQWYAKGNEVADHTFTHVGTPPAQEIAAAKAMLNQYGGVPLGKIQGFRAPFLNYTADTLNLVKQQGLVYDTSSTGVVDDCYWPYTLDYGMATDCWTGICDPGKVKLPGIWEFPMYAVVDSKNTPQLMDVYLAGTVDEVTQWSNTNFDRHYNGNRQPFGIYVHPTHLTTVPGQPVVPNTPDANTLRAGVVSFIQSLASKQDVWFVTNEQLLQWMQNPVPASQLANQSYMKCELPKIDKEICNGLEQINITSVGVANSPLLNHCNLDDTNFGTCFNCPGTKPTVDNPTPPTSVATTDPNYRHPLPDNCDSIWWDPVAGQCLCTTASCQYKDVSTVSPGGNGNSNPSSGHGSSSGHGHSASPSSTTTLLGSIFIAAALSWATSLL